MPLNNTSSAHNLSLTHATDLAATRCLITTLITALEREMITPALEETTQGSPSKAVLWGEKENAVGALVKLTSLLLKVIPLEQQLAGNSAIETGDEPLSPEDSDILERYVERMGSLKNRKI